MTDDNGFRLYRGDGSTLTSRGTSLPPLANPASLDEPAGYLAESALRDAVNVAIVLGQPLLVTGEPGTGKTQLAGNIAYELGLPPPLTFNTKSNSIARDLFYRYDSLRHFHDTQFREQHRSAEDYVEFEALGLAILLAMPASEGDGFLPPDLRGRGPSRSVVLIDEVDKAPRDLPNDVLNEIEEMSFTIRETGRTFRADARFKPIVVLTSNSEKTLPDAFLRRCVFCHLTFPSRERLVEIVRRRLGATAKLPPDRLEWAIRHFEQIRTLALRKKPSTAELIAWLRVLDRLDLDLGSATPETREAIGFTYAILAKSREDLDLMQEQMRE